MKAFQVLLAASVVLMAGAALAAAQDVTPPPQREQHLKVLERTPGEPGIGFLHAEMMGSLEQVKGAPYAATAVTESTQVLADGNRIVNKSSGLVARDSEGRIRREGNMGRIGPLQVAGPNMIFVYDPVAQAAYVLNPDTKVARVMKGAGLHRPMREMRKMRSLHGPGEPGAQGQLKRESLGTQQIEGVTAEGMRITRTIPAGAIGNDKPIDITLETWTSPDLDTLVLSKRSDPRFGETVYRLTNIKRGEPDAGLFQIPSGYKTEQGPPAMRMRHPGPPPAPPQE